MNIQAQMFLTTARYAFVGFQTNVWDIACSLIPQGNLTGRFALGENSQLLTIIRQFLS